MSIQIWSIHYTEYWGGPESWAAVSPPLWWWLLVSSNIYGKPQTALRLDSFLLFGDFKDLLSDIYFLFTICHFIDACLPYLSYPGIVFVQSLNCKRWLSKWAVIIAYWSSQLVYEIYFQIMSSGFFFSYVILIKFKGPALWKIHFTYVL